MASRVAVFIDYQNVYKRARECFGYDRDHHIHGQVLPLRLGLVLRDMGIGERDLVAVNVYRGMPSSRHALQHGRSDGRRRRHDGGRVDHTDFNVVRAV